MRRHRIAVATVVPLLALGLSACGGGDPTAAGKTPGAADDATNARKFAQCMRDNGVNMPDPEIGDDGGIKIRMGEGPKDGEKPDAAGEAKTKAAMEKCRKFMPNGGKPMKPSAAELAQMRAHAKCMREHGIDMPDPEPDGRIVIKNEGGSGQFGPDDPKFKAADKACQKLRPKPRKRQP